MAAGGPASPTASLVIGIFLIALGGVLAFDIKDISSSFHKGNWDAERRARWPNPYQLVGWAFLLGGTYILVYGIIHSV
jgi:hypothetical protein